MDSDRPPFEFIDARNVYSGISASFMQECARRLGLKLKLVPGLTVAQALDKVALGEIDVVPKATITAERGKYLLFTAPYDTSPSVIVSRKDARFIGGMDDLDGLKVGVLKGAVVEELLQRDHPELILVAVANIQDALLQLSKGRIDVLIENLESASYNIDQLGLTDLKIATPTPYIGNMAFGVRKDMPLLHSALDKALASMPTQAKSAIRNKWLGIAVQKGPAWTSLAPYVGAIGVVVLLLIVRNLFLRRTMREREGVQGELEAHARLLEDQAQIKSRLAALSSDLQKARTFGELAQACFTQIAPMTGMASGALHILDEPAGILRFAGGYGRT
ncbi:MAG TPA: transporter substrate-binding domain-containing protein, partial [Holophaga sp.]|nr:transporter substrate-binding domain-containing protein [Holophaga sp.]